MICINSSEPNRQFKACATNPTLPHAKKSARNSIVFCESIETLSPFSSPRLKSPLAIFFTRSSSSEKVILLFDV